MREETQREKSVKQQSSMTNRAGKCVHVCGGVKHIPVFDPQLSLFSLDTLPREWIIT